MKKNTNSSFLVILVTIGFILRLLFSYSQYSGDIKNHFVWGNSIITNPVGFYTRHFSGFNDPNYPPVAIYFFAFSNFLYTQANNLVLFLNEHVSVFPSALVPFFADEHMQYLFLKLPGIVADVLSFVFLFKLLQIRKSKHPRLLSYLYLFNPAIIYVSAVWGQIEPITILFLILSLYLSYSQKYSFWSIAVFVLGILTKQTVLWFAPIYLILWYQKSNLKFLIAGLLVGLIIFFLSYLPFGMWPIEAVVSYFSTLSGSSIHVSDAAWNVWYFLLPSGVEDTYQIGLFSVRFISVVILSLSLLFFCISQIKKNSDDIFYRNLFLWSLLVYFVQTRVHERHLAFAIPFILLAYPKSNVIVGYLFLSIFYLLNLYTSLGVPFI